MKKSIAILSCVLCIGIFSGCDNEGVISGDIFDDNIFISDEVYMDIQNRLGEENAQQLSVFAENYRRVLLPGKWQESFGCKHLLEEFI